MVASSESGVAFSVSAVDAPWRRGNASMPPRPKVKARGGVPQKISFGRTLRIDCGKQSHIARMSRWKCIVPLGSPVVPEVKAISATSSAAVSTARKSPGLRLSISSSEPVSPSLK